MFKPMTKKNRSEGISLVFVTFGSHLNDAPLNSWWIDTAASIHNIKGFVTFYRLNEETDERRIVSTLSESFRSCIEFDKGNMSKPRKKGRIIVVIL